MNPSQPSNPNSFWQNLGSGLYNGAAGIGTMFGSPSQAGGYFKAAGNQLGSALSNVATRVAGAFTPGVNQSAPPGGFPQTNTQANNTPAGGSTQTTPASTVVSTTPKPPVPPPVVNNGGNGNTLALGPNGQPIQYTSSANGSIGVNQTPPPPQTSNVTVNPSNSTSSSSVSSEPNTFNDLLNTVNNNLSTYQQTAQTSAQETAAEQNLLTAIQNAQNYRTNLTQGELQQYGVGGVVSAESGRAAQMEFNSGVNLQNLQNAENYAQTQLGYAQQERQLNQTGQQGVTNASITAAGLLKPSYIAGSGVQTPSISDLTGLATTLFQNGAFPDYQSALTYVTQNYQSIIGATNGSQGGASTGNTTTSTLGSNATGTSTVPTQSGDTVMGYNFGASSSPNGLGAYAPANAQGQSYSSLISTALQNVPNNVTTPSTIQSYISSTTPNSPITGQMVYNAASQFGVDPRVMLAVMQHESNFGTLGAATTTFNPGNVGNTGIKTTNQGTWQNGVNALAQNLEQRYVGNTGPQTTNSAIGGQFNSTAASQVESLPTPFQGYVDAGPQGVAYINQDRITNLPAATQSAIQLQAEKIGIPVIQGADAAALKSLGVVMQATASMQTLVNSTLNSGLVGGIEDMGKSLIHDLTGGNAFPELSQYNVLRDVAIKAVGGLAGGAGSGLRINSAEIMANVNNLPGASDTLENANTKLQAFTQLVNEQLQATFPYLSQTQANNGSNNGSPDATSQYLTSLGY